MNLSFQFRLNILPKGTMTKCCFVSGCGQQLCCKRVLHSQPRVTSQLQVLTSLTCHMWLQVDQLTASSFPQATVSGVRWFKDGWQKKSNLYLSMCMQTNYTLYKMMEKVLNSRCAAVLSSLLQRPPSPGSSFLTSSSLGSCLAMFFSKETVGFLAVSRMSWTFRSPRSSRPLARIPTLITPFSSRAGFSFLTGRSVINTCVPLIQPHRRFLWPFSCSAVCSLRARLMHIKHVNKNIKSPTNHH